MRTAEEIIKEATEKNIMNLKDAWIYAINEARKETIEECAKQAETICKWNGCDECEFHGVSEVSILKLINELK